MQPFIEQPQFLLEPKSSYLLDTKPVQLECQAIRTRQIFFNCDNKWLPEQEHRKSTTLNVSSAIHLDIERSICLFRIKAMSLSSPPWNYEVNKPTRTATSVFVKRGQQQVEHSSLVRQRSKSLVSLTWM